MVIASMALALSACSRQEASSGLNINEAKSQAQEMEDSIAALVPPEYVDSIDQVAHGNLMSCGTKSVQWYGHTYITLKGNPDFERVLRSITAGVKHTHSDYDVRMGKRPSGTPRAEISGPFGAFYIAAPSPNESQYQIMSYSPCFELPDGMSLGDTY